MSAEKITRMANQIATFFETAADGDAPEQVADHINQFWPPRMRKELLQLQNGELGELNPIAISARQFVNPVK